MYILVDYRIGYKLAILREKANADFVLDEHSYDSRDGPYTYYTLELLGHAITNSLNPDEMEAVLDALINCCYVGLINSG